MARPRQLLVLVSSVALIWAASCAVFPDEAVLPSSGGSELGGAGAHTIDVLGGAAGDLGGSENRGGAAGTGGTGGASSAGEAGSTNGGVAGMTPNGGAAGEPGCDAPKQQVVMISTDTWIEAAKPSAAHGDDKTLSVVGGGMERRALVALTLPAAPVGATLIKATLTLQLESNADATLALRHLGLYRLAQQFDESKANWTNWDSGANRQWVDEGGDFGSLVASAMLAAGSSQGPVIFDVTQPLRLVISAQARPLSLIIIELGPPPGAPADLAFTSSEADASKPALVLDYCQP